VPGTGADAGAPLARHRGVEKVSFTGSPETGRKIALAAAESFTPITLELGGKSPQLIFADAELERAIPASAASFYGNAGQICAAGTRVLVQSDVADEVSEGLSRAAQGVRVGDPFAPETTIGPLINAKQLQRVLGYIDQGRTEGADLITGGGRVGTTGYFVEPTLFRGSNDLVISQEEIFGPVATVIPFTDLDEAIAIANTTRYGLSAGIWTRDVSKAHLVASRLRAGSVNINGGGPPVPNLPWGGFKESGVGRELSFSGIEACTEEKSVRVYLT
jgi:acyl-CoA reductase-like NAD-dependent aldehyde dehydrogenase